MTKSELFKVLIGKELNREVSSLRDEILSMDTEEIKEAVVKFVYMGHHKSTKVPVITKEEIQFYESILLSTQGLDSEEESH